MTRTRRREQNRDDEDVLNVELRVALTRAIALGRREVAYYLTMATMEMFREPREKISAARP